jgi:hypothetical protein
MPKITSGKFSRGDDVLMRRYEQKALHVSELPLEIVDELGAVPVPGDASQFDHECEPQRPES